MVSRDSSGIIGITLLQPDSGIVVLPHLCEPDLRFIQHEKKEVAKEEIIRMSTEVTNTSKQECVRWTRQADGGYAKEGNLPADTSVVRIYVIDEDYEWNPHAVCSGQKLWLKEEAIALVDRKIAEGSYREWRYEIRPEMSGTETPSGPEGAPSESPAPHICSNQRCKKGPNDTPGIVKSRRAKYCCNSCRVDVCRRNRPTPERTGQRGRKRRRDAKYTSHAERQRAYQARHSLAGLPQGIKDLLSLKARRPRVSDSRTQELT